MKILQVINVRWYNAEADYALKLSKALSALGHEVTVMGIKGSPVVRMAGAAGLKTMSDIDLNTQGPVSVLLTYSRLKRWLKSERFDVANFHRSEGFIVGALACKKAGTRVVRTRGDMRPVRRGTLNRWLYVNLTDFIITSGEVIKQSLIDRLGCPAEKIKTIYTAVDTDFFTPEKRSDRLKEELKLKSGNKIIAILGRIGSVKGHDHFLRAARRVKDTCADAEFLIIGKDANGDEGTLNALIQELGLGDDLHFIMGRRDDIDIIAASVDVGVITSTASEANCRVAIEWMSSGVPVAAFATGVIPEVVKDGLDGYVVPTGDHSALADKICTLLSDGGDTGGFTATTRKSVVERYSLEKLAKDTVEVYKCLK